MDNVQKWIKFYNSPNIEVQMRALESIVNIDDKRILPTLLDALPLFGHHGFGEQIVQALRRNHDESVVEPLILLLDHPNPSTVAGACRALGYIGDKKATKPVLNCLNHPTHFVQIAAAYAFANQNLVDPEAAPYLKEKLRATDEANVNIPITWALRRLQEES